MRGKGFFLPLCCGLSRITPAYAGKRTRTARSRTQRRDHPRVCGEKTHKDMTTEDNMGSPPRMRGKDICVFVRIDCRGITPAYAGKSPACQTTDLLHRDHPRVCGEKLDVFDTDKSHLGSPPRMRGKAFLRQCRNRCVGITPAYAGKSREKP